MACIGIDLGGTQVKGGIVGADHKVLAKDTVPTGEDKRPEPVVAVIKTLVEQLCTTAAVPLTDVVGVGVGVPGVVVPAEGLVVKCANLHDWVNVPLGKLLGDALGRPVRVENDADVAALGEFTAAKASKGGDVQHAAVLTLGTGIGSGLIVAGQLLRGGTNGGEVGHMLYELNGRSCGCGAKGCVERYASATALVAIAKERLEAGQESSLKGVEDLACEHVIEAAVTKGDPMASKLLDTAAEAVAVACINLCRVMDPQVVVFGGGVANAGQALLDRIQSSFDALNWSLPGKPALTLALLGNDAGFVGAAAAARPV